MKRPVSKRFYRMSGGLCRRVELDRYGRPAEFPYKFRLMVLCRRPTQARQRGRRCG